MIHRKWTPVELTVLLACYYNREENNGLLASPAHAKAIVMWMSLGYIRPVPKRTDDPMDRFFVAMHETTDRGDSMVDVLCSTSLFLPLP